MADDRNQPLNQENERKDTPNPDSRNQGTEQKTGNTQQQERGETSGRGESGRETGLGEESEAPSDLNKSREGTEQDV